MVGNNAHECVSGVDATSWTVLDAKFAAYASVVEMNAFATTRPRITGTDVTGRMTRYLSFRVSLKREVIMVALGKLPLAITTVRRRGKTAH